MQVEYNSNNSGGRWWLTGEDWKALESSGWEVRWFSNQTDTIFKPDSEGRWLGALASRAIRNNLSLREAVDEWERVTGKSSTEAGCPCCGNPHRFTEYDDNGNWVANGPHVSYEAHW